jgi:signal transduction histidine kinase
MAELTASLSHELNQPLTAILYNAQAGMRFLKAGKLDSRQATEIFENIIEDDKRAGGLISSIRNLMKVESRAREKVSIGPLIDETMEIFNIEAHRNQITVTSILEGKMEAVLGDKIQLQQVLMNFLLNAAIALETSKTNQRLIEIVQKYDQDTVIVSVTDSGPGINPDLLDKIFDPFITTRKDGFGIGLAICRTIIQKHNGKIWAENMAHGGARFSFSLQIIKNDK